MWEKFSVSKRKSAPPQGDALGRFGFFSEAANSFPAAPGIFHQLPGVSRAARIGDDRIGQSDGIPVCARDAQPSGYFLHIGRIERSVEALREDEFPLGRVIGKEQGEREVRTGFFDFCRRARRHPVKRAVLSDEEFSDSAFLCMLPDGAEQGRIDRFRGVAMADEESEGHEINSCSQIIHAVINTGSNANSTRNYNPESKLKSRVELHKLMPQGGVSVKERKELNVILGMNLQRERERMGWTQEKFAEMIPMGDKNLSAIECGSKGISIQTLVRMCKVLNVSSDTLLFENTPKNDVQHLTAQLERLSPEQFRIVRDVVYKLMEAFALNEGGEE